MLEELRDFINENDKVTYAFSKSDLQICSDVEEVEFYGDSMRIYFNKGIVDVERVVKVRRPSNLIINCERCYRLFNSYGEVIGDIYKRDEVK